jgi:hypothetical protein
MNTKRLLAHDLLLSFQSHEVLEGRITALESELHATKRELYVLLCSILILIIILVSSL